MFHSRQGTSPRGHCSDHQEGQPSGEHYPDRRGALEWTQGPGEEVPPVP